MADRKTGGTWSRRAPYLIPAILTLLTTILGILTNIGTAVVPTSWAWAHKPQYVWGGVLFLLFMTITVGVVQQRISAWRDPDVQGDEDVGRADAPESAVIANKNFGTILQATNSVVNLYGPQVPKSGSGKFEGDAFTNRKAKLAWNAPRRIAKFEGREGVLRELHGKLSSGGPQGVCSVYGLGGVGKTGLAIEYAHRYVEHYELVWWVNAGDPDSIAQQFALLAERLGLAGYTDAEKCTTALEYLRRTPKWLVIFDDAEDPRHITDLMPHGDGHVIITTRRTTFASLGESISVDIFKREESIAFLRRRISRIGQGEYEKLAGALGDLPLALEQAAAYLDTTHLPLSYYLSLWKTRSEELLERGHVVGHEHTIATVWDLSVERVVQEQPTALDLLRISAFLAPNAIPTFLFSFGADELPEPLATVARDKLLLADVTGTLTSYSLCQTAGDGDVVVLTFHRLVQAATRRKLSDQERESFAGIALRLLEHEAPSDTRLVPETWPWWYMFMQHVLTATRHGERFSSNAEPASWLLSHAAAYFQTQGRPRQAIPLFERALAIAESNFASDPWPVAVILSELSESLANAGDIKRSSETMERARRIAEALPDDGSGRDKSLTVSSAMIMRRTGHLKEAKRILLEYINEHGQSERSDQSTLASAWAHLSAVLFDLGEYGEAISASEQAVAMTARGGGSDLRTANSLNNIAASLQRLGKIDKAAESYSRSLEIQLAIYGPSHPHVAVALNNLGSVMKEKGDLEAAKELIGQALEINEEALGHKSPETLRTLSNLGAVTRALGDAEGAEMIYRRVLAETEAMHGLTHPDVARASSNLAIALSEDNKPQEAHSLALRAVLIAERSFGVNHIEVAMRLVGLAQIEDQLGRAREARQAYRRALAIARKEMNRHDPRAIRLREVLGLMERIK